MSVTAALETSRPLSRRRIVVLCTLALVLSVAAAVLGAILDRNGGTLVYSLDDPYIHLALARNIAAVHYGINPGEAAAPASSILYPFLLSLFVPLGIDRLAPLLINLAALSVSVVLLASIVLRLVSDEVPAWVAVVLTAVIALAVNLVGLVFTGMEHSLHVMLTLAVLYGVIVAAERRELPWWLMAALILGPLVRYEGCAVTLGGMVALLWLGHRRRPLLAAAVAVLALAAFSAMLWSLGLSPLPSSVLAKSVVAAAGVGGSLTGIVAAVLATLAALPATGMLIGLLAAAIAVAVVAKLRSDPRSPAIAVGLFAVIVAAGHLAAGRYNWLFRFEIYAFASVLLGTVYVYRHRLQSTRRALIAACAIAVVGLPYLRGITDTPLSANNVFEQQYQMHRFVHDFYQRPVAVNDLGWVAYDNPAYVLDLWGLGYEPARVARFAAASAALAGKPAEPWMSHLVEQRPVGLAMVYDEWFADALPAGWMRVARLWRGHASLTGQPSVSFYATAAAARADIDAALDRFAPTLPPGVRLERLP